MKTNNCKINKFEYKSFIKTLEKDNVIYKILIKIKKLCIILKTNFYTDNNVVNNNVNNDNFLTYDEGILCEEDDHFLTYDEICILAEEDDGFNIIFGCDNFKEYCGFFNDYYFDNKLFDVDVGEIDIDNSDDEEI